MEDTVPENRGKKLQSVYWCRISELGKLGMVGDRNRILGLGEGRKNLKVEKNFAEKD